MGNIDVEFTGQAAHRICAGAWPSMAPTPAESTRKFRPATDRMAETPSAIGLRQNIAGANKQDGFHVKRPGMNGVAHRESSTRNQGVRD